VFTIEVRTTRASLCFCLGLTSAACSHPPDPETHWTAEQSWSSAHFIYHARPDDGTVDAGVLDYLEANAALIAHGQLGLEPASWGPVHYFKYRDDADFAAANGCQGLSDALACCDYFSDGRTEIHSPLAVDPHELVHAYARSLGVPPWLLIEGLAVSLSCDPSAENILVSDGGWPRDNLEKTPWPPFYQPSIAGGDEYLAAGLLTTWLVDHAGMSAVLSLYARVPPSASVQEFAAAVLDATGTSMDAAWQAMAASPVRRPCLDVAACTVLDPTSSANVRSEAVSPVPAAGMLVSWLDPGLSALSAPPALRGCAASDAVSTDMAWPILLVDSPASQTTLFLPNRAGYVLRSGQRETPWDGGPGAPTAYSATAAPATSFGPSCAGLAPISVDDSGLRIQVWPRPTPLVFGVAPATSGSPKGYVQAGPAGDPTDAAMTDFEVDICTSCTAGTLGGCTALTPALTFNWPTFPLSGPLWVQVRWNPPNPTELLSVGLQF
jgi:hypothetical protein